MMFRDFNPDLDQFKVVCQNCGKTGEVEIEKVRSRDFSDGFYYFSENKKELGEVEWFLCSACYKEIFMEHDEL
ncbi:MAG: hypothetical protein R6U44_02265 [Archaeoglobaceae archaeon]